jgi:ACR3 family arsenite efflux pump ArsB
MWMGMTDGNHGMTAVQVQIGLAFFVIHIIAFAPYGLEVVERIYVEEFHFSFLSHE